MYQTSCGSRIECVRKGSKISCAFTADGEAELVEVTSTGRVRHLPLATMVYQENPQEVKQLYLWAGAAWSSRTEWVS